MIRGVVVVALLGTAALIRAQAPAAPVPVSYGLLFDNSSSVRSQVDAMIDVSKALIRENRPGDKAFIVRFTNQDNLNVLQDLTSDSAALLDEVDNLFVEPGPSAAIDAIYVSLEYLDQYVPAKDSGRRAIIVMTGGDAGKNHYELSDLREKLRGRTVPIYVIVFGGGGSKDLGVFKALTVETRGRLFVPTSKTEWDSSIRSLAAIIRTR